MKRKRRTFTADVKAKIALEAMKGEKTINEIAQLYEVHPNQVSQWKGEMLANAASAFDKGKRATDQAERSERKQEKLYKKIGELSMDVEFLKKSCRKLGVELPNQYDD
jgi:transposase-like protein|tara:strand:- start:994 stop:1317 length:324 start_codon:yes stop_codon:yes gene_type:complete